MNKHIMNTNMNFAAGIKMMVVALVVMMVAACSSRHCEDYETVVPKEANMVVAVRCNSLLNKSGVSRNPLLKIALKNAGNAMGKDMGDKLVEMLKDPSISGLDLDSPAYLFQVNGQCYGLSIKVEDESLVDEFVKLLANHNFCGKIKEEDGKKWGTVLDEIQMVYTDNTMLLLTDMSGATKKSTEKLLQTLIELDEDDSFVSTKQYEQFCKHDGNDVQVYGNMAAVPSKFAPKQMPLPKGAKPSDVELVAGASIKDGIVEVNTLFFSQNEDLQKEIDQQFASVKPMTGEYINKIPSDCQMFMCMGANGVNLLDMLKQIPQMKEALTGANFGVDADNMIRAIDGDMLVVNNVSKHDYNRFAPLQLSVYAQLGNKDFMKDVESWKASAKNYGITFESIGNNQYKVTGDDKELYWAVNDDELYLGQAEYMELSQNKNTLLAEEMKGKCIYAQVSFDKRIPLISTMSVSSDQSGELTFKMRMRDASQNILGLLVGEIWK